DRERTRMAVAALAGVALGDSGERALFQVVKEHVVEAPAGTGDEVGRGGSEHHPPAVVADQRNVARSVRRLSGAVLADADGGAEFEVAHVDQIARILRIE